MMNKLSSKYLFPVALFFLTMSAVKADVEITPVISNPQNDCNNYIAVRLNAAGFSNLIALDFGITWDPMVMELASYHILEEPGMNSPTINISMASSGKFAYFFSDLDNTGESLPSGTPIIELLFRATGSGSGTAVAVEDIMGFVANEAYDFNFDPIAVVGNTLTFDVNTPVVTQLKLDYEVLKAPNGCNDSLQIAVKVGECFFDMTTLQFSLSWDPAKFMYLSNATPYFPGGDASFTNVTEVFSNGRFGYGWGSLTNPTASAPDGSVLLILTFKTIGVGASVIQAANDPLLIEASDQNFEVINVVFTPPTLNVSTNNYYTVADGLYYSASTWKGGCIPTDPIMAGTVVNINHSLTLPIAESITNLGTIISSVPFVNYGTYQGTGNFMGSFINNGTLKPGDN